MKFSMLLGFMLALVSGHQAQAQDAASFYKGKTVRVVVGFSSGGGYDQYGRLFARHANKHIAGNPSVVVQNMPGAASLKALQFLDSGAPTDGTVLVTFNPGLITGSLTSPARNPIDFRQFAWIGNIAEDIRVCFTWGPRNIKTFDAFLAKDKLSFGNTGVGTSAYIDNRILQVLFGVKLRMVQGYPGSADKKLAIENGELDGDCGSWTSMPEDWLREKKVDIHLRFSKNLGAGMSPDIPWAFDLLKDPEKKETLRLLLSGAEIGRPFVASRQVPPPLIGALRSAFNATMKDAEFLADADKQRLLVGPDEGPYLEKRIGEIYATPPHIIAAAREIAGE